MSSELVYTTSTGKRPSSRAVATQNYPIIRIESEDVMKGTGRMVIGSTELAVHHLDAEPDEDRVASFVVYGERWSEYRIWLYVDRVEIARSFYDTSEGDPPRSAFDAEWQGNPASFFRFVKNELYPDYLAALKKLLT